MDGSNALPDASSTVLLPSSPQSPGLARAAIRGVCVAADLADEVSDTASLLTSELVSNVYQHGRGAMMMAADVRGVQLRVSVTDSGNGPPPAAPPSSDGDLNVRGRGLLLVSSLATRWGTRPRASRGKAVWFELEPVR
jgi:anti-sigma regulatory factor (Ser/Thr protein kinase)